MQTQKRLCDAKYCYYNVPRENIDIEKFQHEIKLCPLCLKAQYCSKRCRDLDWNQNHKKNCISSNLVNQVNQINSGRSKSANESYESEGTMKSMRRKPDEFEVVLKNGKVELGKGSYGSVKLVRDKLNGREYAMKIMQKKHIFQYCTVENLKREIKIQRKLQHPHITKLYNYFEDKDSVYLILEYAENGSLFSYLKRKKKLSEREAFVYFFQTCLGIDYLHKNNIIHRDLKPENLLLDKDGNIKVCDFGWSAETASFGQQRTTFCGTYEYMAPEMIKNEPHDQSLDIWTLGILLFELLHGYAPYRGQNDRQVCDAILSNKPIAFDSQLSFEAKQLIVSILKPKPNERLSMRGILNHPWMVNHSKSYQIDIWHYVYQPNPKFRIDEYQSNPQIPSENIRTFPQSANNSTGKEKTDHHVYTKSQNIQKIDALISNKPDISNFKHVNHNENNDLLRPRVSRVSNRNDIMLHQKENQQQMQKQQDQELNFMDRVFMAFGCLKRDRIK